MNKLMEKRKEINLTREDLSEKTGLSAEEIRDLELGLVDIWKQDEKTVNKLAQILNIKPLKLKQGCYYTHVGNKFKIACFQYIIITHEEWQKLNWEKSGVQMHHRYKYTENNKEKELFIQMNGDAAFVLGYKLFAGINTQRSVDNITECYIKNGRLYMFSLKKVGDDNIYITEIPCKPEEVIIR